MCLSCHSRVSGRRWFCQPFGPSAHCSNTSLMVWCSARDSKVSIGSLGKLTLFSLLAGADDNDLALPSWNAEHRQWTFFTARNCNDHNCGSSIRDRNCGFRLLEIFSFRGQGHRNLHRLRHRTGFVLSLKFPAGHSSSLAVNSKQLEAHLNSNGANADRVRRHTIQVCIPGVSISVNWTPLSFSHDLNWRFTFSRPSSVPQAIQSSLSFLFTLASRPGNSVPKSCRSIPPELKPPIHANSSR